MSDLKELIEREMESFIEWDGDDKSIVTTTSAKLFAEHVAGLWADHVAGARNMVAAVQGEPARHDWDEQDKCRRCGDRDWYAGPICTPKQPAEQQPIPSSLAYDASIHLTNWLNMNLCECEGGHTCGYNEVRRTRDALLAVAEKKQDITQLVEALRMLAVAGNRLNDEAEECTYDDGVAEVASVDFWGDFREALEAADAALAPYRKRGDI